MKILNFFKIVTKLPSFRRIKSKALFAQVLTLNHPKENQKEAIFSKTKDRSKCLNKKIWKINLQIQTKLFKKSLKQIVLQMITTS